LLRDGASSLQALEALETPLMELMAPRVMRKMSSDKLVPIFAEICSPCHILRYPPEPSRKGVVARDEDIVAKPSKRGLPGTIVWVAIWLLLVA
jgi:hypothetical protein